ncbi:hypothetical protein CEXT_201101 [Caerostris extrusa]|uniref:Uncharacterized protein n=1 Tax=Caerostris extrusa TaxID=172846 RepID=A0AAV4S5Y5_CAEEX|nr:hypothetical protein CEXT_201101 [Caerostris extrusa]
MGVDWYPVIFIGKAVFSNLVSNWTKWFRFVGCSLPLLNLQTQFLLSCEKRFICYENSLVSSLYCSGYILE